MSYDHFDAVIVGCGIAGAALAWQLDRLGKRLLVVDEQSAPSASKAAAGVMSPITGKRHTPTWRWQEFWPEACSFYQQIESHTDSRLLRFLPQLRFPQLPLTEDILRRVETVGEFIPAPLDFLPPTTNPSLFRYGAIKIENGVVDVKQFLQETYKMLTDNHRLYATKLSYCAIDYSNEKITIPFLNAESNNIIFCEGAWGESNPWFDSVSFQPVRGACTTSERADSTAG